MDSLEQSKARAAELKRRQEEDMPDWCPPIAVTLKQSRERREASAKLREDVSRLREVTKQNRIESQRARAERKIIVAFNKGGLTKASFKRKFAELKIDVPDAALEHAFKRLKQLEATQQRRKAKIALHFMCMVSIVSPGLTIILLQKPAGMYTRPTSKITGGKRESLYHGCAANPSDRHRGTRTGVT